VLLSVCHPLFNLSIQLEPGNVVNLAMMFKLSFVKACRNLHLCNGIDRASLVTQ